MLDLDHEPEFIASSDGTMLALRRLGDPKSPPLLLVPSVGSNLAPWRRALLKLIESHHVLTWDLRGLHDSGPSVSAQLGASAHAEDAEAVLTHVGLSSAPVIAWSTGGRIALELASQHPERVGSLVLVCGMNGYPLKRLVKNFDVPVLLPLLAKAGKYLSIPLGAALRQVASRPEMGGIVRQSGMLAPTADIAAFVDMIKGLAECDTRTLLKTYEVIAGDPAPEALAGVNVPTLLIRGEKDPFTPRGMTEELRAAIQGSTVVDYESATHFLPLEFPARLATDIERFLAGSAA